jgi:hypothetical protein
LDSTNSSPYDGFQVAEKESGVTQFEVDFSCLHWICVLTCACTPASRKTAWKCVYKLVPAVVEHMALPHERTPGKTAEPSVGDFGIRNSTYVYLSDLDVCTNL